jgi:hypothetical protein
MSFKNKHVFTAETWVRLLVGAMAIGAVACNDSSSSASAPAPSPAGSATVTGANATIVDALANVENKSQVKELADDVKMTPPKQAALITGFTIQVRESPGGDIVTTSEAVERVTEIAHDASNDYYLVVYADPKAPGKQLAGWVYKDALENNAWWGNNAEALSGSANGAAKDGSGAGMTKLACASGESHLRTTKDFCAKVCKDDTGCDKRAGDICDGLGFQVQESSGKLSNATYCIPRSSSKANAAHGPQHGPSAPLDVLDKNAK